MNASLLLILLAAYELWAQGSRKSTLTDIGQTPAGFAILIGAMAYFILHLRFPTRVP